jgi:hypothetical protein
MNREKFEVSEEDRTRLRTAVATIDRQISCLGREDTVENHRAATTGLASSWAGLVNLLALGPAPLVRACPLCQHVCRLAATRCGHCWSLLSAHS